MTGGPAPANNRPNGRFNGLWAKAGIVLTLATMIVGAVLAYADVRARSAENKSDIAELRFLKANKETVDAQFQAVLRELELFREQMNARFDRLERTR